MTHIRNLSTNRTLQAVYHFIKDNPMAGSWQLVKKLKILNPGGITSEINTQIREFGQKIVCYRVYTKTEKHHFYKLVKI